MLQSAYLFAKIGADTAEDERHFAENCGRCRTERLRARVPARVRARGLGAGLASRARRT